MRAYLDKSWVQGHSGQAAFKPMPTSRPQAAPISKEGMKRPLGTCAKEATQNHLSFVSSGETFIWPKDMSEQLLMDRFLNFFKAILNLSSVNTPRPKTQISYQKIPIVCKLLSSISRPEVYSFLKYLYATERYRQVTLKIHNSVLDRLGATHFWPFATFVWVATHTLGTTVSMGSISSNRQPSTDLEAVGPAGEEKVR